MSQENAQQEPSMEDILASIRKILSEDEEKAEERAPEPEPEPFVFPEPEPEPEPEPDLGAWGLEEDEEEPLVLDQPAFEPKDEVLELTEDMFVDDEPIPEPEPEPPPFVSEIEDDPVDERLISATTEVAAGGLLAELASAVARERTIGLGHGGVTLEDMVREILRQLLKDWLDENLPYMTERLVQKEIERLVDRAEKL